jgi:hypothetical protein
MLFGGRALGEPLKVLSGVYCRLANSSTAEVSFSRIIGQH